MACDCDCLLKDLLHRTRVLLFGVKIGEIPIKMVIDVDAWRLASAELLLQAHAFKDVISDGLLGVRRPRALKSIRSRNSPQ
jgi:hypothetical protein